MSRDKKLIYFLVALIIFLAIILLIKIKTTPNYNPELYTDIYNEYEEIFGKENDINEINKDNMKKIEDNNITYTNNTFAIQEDTNSNVKKGNVIGKIIIPKIDMKSPIIKETTTEYLKIAPTKYCGPDVNEIRKFSYSRAQL